MVEVRIVRYKTIVNSPAVRLLLNGWIELANRNLIDPGAIKIAWDHEALVAEALDGAHAGNAVGALSFQHLQWANEYSTILAWVHPGLRIEGIHKRMFEALVKEAQADKVQVITSGVYLDNFASHKAHISEGRRPIGTIYQFDVPKDNAC